jgi:hypothetical protein
LPPDKTGNAVEGASVLERLEKEGKTLFAFSGDSVVSVEFFQEEIREERKGGPAQDDGGFGRGQRLPEGPDEKTIGGKVVSGQRPGGIVQVSKGQGNGLRRSSPDLLQKGTRRICFPHQVLRPDLMSSLAGRVSHIGGTEGVDGIRKSFTVCGDQQQIHQILPNVG